MSDFEVIIVGAGCAGSVAAYELANAGKSVLLIDRGTFAGAKNMTGGRIYTHVLEDVFPDFRDEAPLERRISHERISFVTETAGTTLDFTSDAFAQKGQESYSVLRASFDQWLAEKAESAGAECIFGIPVESLLFSEDKKVIGVRAGEDEITGDVIMLCDGVNSLLVPQAQAGDPSAIGEPKADAYAVGIKQVIQLPAKTISERIGVSSDEEGLAWLLSGWVSGGVFGGGYVYTNIDTVSVGVVAGIGDLAARGEVPITEMIERVKNHPLVAPLIEGGRLLEHSGHMIPEGGFNAMPDLSGNGYVVCGDAAIMCINLGYQVRGMDYAIESGKCAARAVLAACEDQDFSARSLQRYEQELEKSFVLQDLKRLRKMPHVMESCTGMFTDYPVAAQSVMESLFVVDGSPIPPMKKQMMSVVKELGVWRLLKDAKSFMGAM